MSVARQSPHIWSSSNAAKWLLFRVSCPETVQSSFFDAWKNDNRAAPLRGKAMRLTIAGWTFFGLAVLALAGYGLNRGILVGSRIENTRLSGEYPVPFYKKHCHYLFFNGVQQVWTS